MGIQQSYKGSKARNLLRLAEAGYKVPHFISVQPDITDEQILLNRIPESLKKYSFFAVRSSAGEEDSKEKSYAGHFYSAIGIKLSEVFTEYRKVVASYNEMPGEVIIQQFIPAEKSGVLFTDNGSGHIIVDANFGLCKSVVEGRSCDEYSYSREGKSIGSFIDSSKKPLIFDGSRIVELEKYIDKKVLNKKELSKLIETGLRIENFFGSAQDIEWSIYKKNIYVLQSRPITSYIKTRDTGLYYDSANIAESYSGIVLPLTLTFAKHIYKTVYINLLKASGASSKKLHKHNAIFSEMVKAFYGRLYYNMNNWYLMMSFIPGYNRNKQNLENMITSNITEDIKRDVLPGSLLRIAYPVIVLAKLLIMPFVIGSFTRKVRKYLRKYTSMDMTAMSIDECLDAYRILSKNLLEKWHIPVENDFMVMTYWGILKNRIPEDELKDLIHFKNKSADQIEAILQLSHRIFRQPDLAKTVEESDVQAFEHQLFLHSDILKEYKRYFSEYGGRFANELKLESPDLEEDKAKLLRLFKFYKDYRPCVSHLEINAPDSIFVRYSLRKFKKYAARREVMRLYRSNCFSLVRKLFKQIGNRLSEEKLIGAPEDVFYLNLEDVLSCRQSQKTSGFNETILHRKHDYETFKKIEPVPFFKISEGEEPPVNTAGMPLADITYGRSCTPGIVKGKLRVFKEYYLPESIDFDIIVAKHTDPGWTSLIGLSKGLIIEHGGVLSHAAIVSREMGIPTVIGVQNATNIFTTGQIAEINGSTGLIRIINEE